MRNLSDNVNTAGKITILTSIVGLLVFASFFLFNLGAQELQRVEAQEFATTSLTVLNTPPGWDVLPKEEVASATTTPTNSGAELAWLATATDPSSQPYFLIICSTSTPPTPGQAVDEFSLGTVPPTCDSAAIQWAVSTSTVSGTEARAATTTSEDFPPFAEVNEWYAFICDDDNQLPRCNAVSYQGDGGGVDDDSPFHVNRRPTFTSISNNSPVLPGDSVVFTATADDPDTVPTDHTIRLYICSTNAFTPGSSPACDDVELASSTLVTTNPTASYPIVIPTRDGDYNAYAFIVDEYGHAADPQGGLSLITVGNAAPAVVKSQVFINGSSDLTLTIPEGETTGFTLNFQISDSNSCVNLSATDEIVDFDIAFLRSGVGTSSCDGAVAGNYDANECYPSAVGTSVWNLVCTASSSSCTGPTDTTQNFDCTFPLWYVADATSGTIADSFYFNENWVAAIRAIDDNGATSTYEIGDYPQEVNATMAYELDTLAIPYGQLEAGQFTPTLNASTTFRATGNTGLNQLLQGFPMCNTYTSSSSCPVSPTSTIPENFQVFATSSVSYSVASSSGNFLSSSTPKLLELRVPKSTGTSTQETRNTYWGIAVPSTITFSGTYTGENAFYGVASNPLTW